MKREYADLEEKHHNNGMFSKYHQQTQQSHIFQHHYQPLPPQQLHDSITAKFLPISEEEDDSHSPIQYSTKIRVQEDHPIPPPPPNDGATIEVVRRPRGRPSGSKNKPKPSFIITKESSELSMSPYILELPAGVDIIEATTRFCEKRNIGLCILNGHGVVTNVTLKQPSTNPSATVTFHGGFDILSISATIFASGTTAGLAGNGLFTISVAVGPQGQVMGGVVVKPLVSAATIYLIAATINSPSFYRLQNDEDIARNSGGEDHHESPSTVSGRKQLEQCGINSLYSYDQPSDVIRAPTARQPHQLPTYN